MSVCSALILMESEGGCLFSWGLGCGRLHYRAFVMLTRGSALSSPLGRSSFVCAALSAGLSILHGRGRLGAVVPLHQALSLVCSVGSLWLAAPRPASVPGPSFSTQPIRHTPVYPQVSFSLLWIECVRSLRMENKSFSQTNLSDLGIRICVWLDDVPFGAPQSPL